MEAKPIPHPSAERLAAYRREQLDEPSARAVKTHLDGCAACRARAAAITVDVDATQTYVRQGAEAQPTGEPLPPALVDHPDYTIKRELGRGGMGVVYLAHNTLMGRDEVLKVIGRHVMNNRSLLERFLREIRAVAALRHPNIVTAYSAARRGDGIVFAMELVDGLDLSRLVKSKGPLPVAHACHFAYQAALGLQHAHENGLVHRDIKPGNLMLSRTGKKATLKILDFGLAKLSREAGSLTGDGRALGTPNYMAPEQLVDAQSADIRADIYSLGATLHYLLTGRPPFQANTLEEIYRAHERWSPERLNVVRPDVPAELAAVVETMMARHPADRFSTPREVAQALAPFFKKEQDLARSPDPDRPLERGPQPPIAASGKHLAEPAVAESGWESLIVFDPNEGPAEEERRDGTTVMAAWLWPSVVGLLLVGMVVAWASGIFATGRRDPTIAADAAADPADEARAHFPKTVPLGKRDVPQPAEREPAPEPGSGHDTPIIGGTESRPKEPAKVEATPVASPGGAGAFAPLFNGNDLTGWVPRGCRAGDWPIRDGGLSFRDPNDRVVAPGLRLTPAEKRMQSFIVRNDRSAVLFTERSYVDFRLRLEFQATAVGNSGIVLADLDRGDRLPRYAEFAIGLSDNPGWKAGDYLAWNFGNVVSQVPARLAQLKKAGEWNSLELESLSGSLRLSLNGRPVDYDRPIVLEGPRRIGLRGMSRDAVRFRKIELRGRPASADGGNAQERVLLGKVIYVDDLGDPASGWGREPFKRDYEKGLYYLGAPPEWSGISAWNAWGPLAEDYQFEVVGRVLGNDAESPGAWMVVLSGTDGRGVQVSIDRLGRFAVEPAFWGVEKYPDDPRIGPFAHRAIRPGGEWNELTLRVRKRRLEVLINSARVCEPRDLDFDLLPAQPQIAVSKPDSASRIRAEFDFMELRELKAEGP